MSIAAARALLRAQGLADRQAYKKEYQEAMRTKQQQATDAGWGKILGQWGLTGIATLGAVATGGALSPLAAAVIGGIGARVGSEMGETNWGRRGEIEDSLSLKSRGLGAGTREDYETGIREAYEGFDKSQNTAALMAVGETYLAAGGSVPGTDAWKEAGGLKGVLSPGGAGVKGHFMAPEGQAAFGLEQGTTLKDLWTGTIDPIDTTPINVVEPRNRPITPIEEAVDPDDIYGTYV